MNEMTKIEFAEFYGKSVDEVSWCDTCEDWSYDTEDGYPTCECV